MTWSAGFETTADIHTLPARHNYGAINLSASPSATETIDEDDAEALHDDRIVISAGDDSHDDDTSDHQSNEILAPIDLPAPDQNVV